MLVQRFEPQGRRFTNFHYYYDVCMHVCVRVGKDLQHHIRVITCRNPSNQTVVDRDGIIHYRAGRVHVRHSDRSPRTRALSRDQANNGCTSAQWPCVCAKSSFFIFYFMVLKRNRPRNRMANWGRGKNEIGVRAGLAKR